MKSVVLVLAVMLVSCGSLRTTYTNSGTRIAPTGDTLVTAYGQMPIGLSPVHKAVYEMMEYCTGIQGDIDGVQWAVADSLIQNVQGGERIQRVWGIWNSQTRQIVLDRGLYWLVGLIAHEVMHDLHRGVIPDDDVQNCTPTMSAKTMALAMGINP